MAKKRYISQTINFSTDMNSLTDFQERVWTRLLTNSSDFGVIPSDTTKLRQMTGFDKDRQEEFEAAIVALLGKRLIVKITYETKDFFMFNPKRFDIEQTHIGNRRHCEYTGVHCRGKGTKREKRADFEERLKVIEDEIISVPSKGERRKERGESRGMQGGEIRPAETAPDPPTPAEENPGNVPRDVPQWQEQTVAERAFCLIREVRTTELKPGDVSSFEQRQIQGYANLYGDRILAVIERCANAGWYCTPDQILQTILGQVRPEDAHKKPGTTSPATQAIRRELRTPAPKEPPKEGVQMPDDVRQAFEGMGKRFTNSISDVSKVTDRGSRPATPDYHGEHINPQEILTAEEIAFLSRSMEEGNHRIEKS